MKFYLRLAFLVFFLGFGVYFVSERLTSIKASKKVFNSAAVQSDLQTNNDEITLKVLTAHCGKCHQSSLPTANPKALEIFDLDKKNWYTSVSDKHLESISRRASTKTGISNSDRAAVADFITCVRKGDCKNNN